MIWAFLLGLIAIAVAASLFIAYIAVMLMLIVGGVIWGVWSVILWAILSAIGSNAYDMMILSIALGFVLTLVSFAVYGKFSDSDTAE